MNNYVITITIGEYGFYQNEWNKRTVAAAMKEFFKELEKLQEPLGPEFEKVISENLNELREFN